MQCSLKLTGTRGSINIYHISPIHHSYNSTHLHGQNTTLVFLTKSPLISKRTVNPFPFLSFLHAVKRYLHPCILHHILPLLFLSRNFDVLLSLTNCYHTYLSTPSHTPTSILTFTFCSHYFPI